VSVTTGSALHALAERYGIIGEYVDQTGTDQRRTSDETRVALLAAMGVDGSTEDAAARALEALDARRARDLLPAVRVAPQGTPLEASLAVGEELGHSVEWGLVLTEESGRVRREGGTARRAAGSHASIPIPWRLEPGYHALEIDLHGALGTRTVRQSLVVVPPSCPTPERVLKRRRVYGITANLYTVRSARNWGAGDVGDLESLVRWAGEIGAAFVGVNPLHALRNRGADVSPYSPLSRLFRNVLYLAVERVPELARDAEAQRMLDDPATRARLAELRAADAVDYEAVMALKGPILERMHARFRDDRESGDAAAAERVRAYDAWVESQGEALRDFATFLALEEAMGDEHPDAGWWREWPEPYRDARSREVAEFRAAHETRVDFHRWLQFELDRQIGDVADAASEAGLAVGLYEDLAIGTSPSGSDAWGFAHLFATGASVGAPPDVFQKDGQNWGLPPIDPHKLAADGYRYWIRLVRSALGHAGALRMDHVMGLFRQFWIPEGKTGRDGAYVRFPSDDLLGILALEATRAGALVVGEDLGTVPEDVPPALERWGVLSSKVLYFERDDDGFKPAKSYAPRALATANTHDLPTIAGFWVGRDIALARELETADEKETTRREKEREGERDALLRRLREEGLIGEEEVPEGAALRGAVHDFLNRTPSALVGLSLDDIVGEVEPVNAPGVPPERFSSWTRRLRVALEELDTNADVQRSLGRRERG
jgi:4-alpha-glucanotransferase